MRDNLDFESLASSAGDDGDAPAGAAAKRGSTAHEVLTLDAIRAGVRFQKWCVTASPPLPTTRFHCTDPSRNVRCPFQLPHTA